jgi:hypothetical protein
MQEAISSIALVAEKSTLITKSQYRQILPLKGYIFVALSIDKSDDAIYTV